MVIFVMLKSWRTSKNKNDVDGINTSDRYCCYLERSWESCKYGVVNFLIWTVFKLHNNKYNFSYDQEYTHMNRLLIFIVWKFNLFNCWWTICKIERIVNGVIIQVYNAILYQWCYLMQSKSLLGFEKRSWVYYSKSCWVHLKRYSSLEYFPLIIM